MKASMASGRREVPRWGAVGAGLVLAALSVAFLTMARAEDTRGDELIRAAQTSMLDEARRTLEDAAQNIVIVRILDAASYEGDRTDRLVSASARFAEAVSTIREVAAGDGPVATEAAVLLDDLDAEVIDDPVDGDLDSLHTIAEDSARWAANDEKVTSRHDAIQQLSYVASLPLHVMIEGLAADIAVGDRVVDRSADDVVDELIGVVSTDGGWYGSDPTSPLRDSEWIDIAEATVMLPDATQRLSELTAASSLVVYDAWMRELGAGDTPPPIGTLDALAEADRLTAELTSVIDELLTMEQAAQDDAWSAHESRLRALHVAAAIAALLSFAAGVVAARTASRTRRSALDRAALAMRDALTGAGNRYELDDRTKSLVRSPRFDHHVVVMVDLDRFKLINDVFGHAAGDAVLVEIATRLKQTAGRIESSRPGTETTVIRLGGDEFLLTAHGTHAFDVDAIVAELDAVRRDTLTFGGERIDLEFSIGICHRSGQHDLADLMAAADLAAYDDKAARANQRAATTDETRSPHTTPTDEVPVDQPTR